MWKYIILDAPSALLIGVTLTNNGVNDIDRRELDEILGAIILVLVDLEDVCTAKENDYQN
jgi:hypothetical protein